MDYDTLVKQIQDRGSFESKDHADRAATATLSVLAERMAGGEPRDLAAQLPAGLAEALGREGGRDAFALDEFYRRVAEREGTGCGQEDVRDHARAVLTTVLGSVSAGERDDVVNQLPADWRGELVG